LGLDATEDVQVETVAWQGFLDGLFAASTSLSKTRNSIHIEQNKESREHCNKLLEM
jgi:hypothetical protein